MDNSGKRKIFDGNFYEIIHVFQEIFRSFLELPVLKTPQGD